MLTVLWIGLSASIFFTLRFGNQYLLEKNILTVIRTRSNSIKRSNLSSDHKLILSGGVVGGFLFYLSTGLMWLGISGGLIAGCGCWFFLREKKKQYQESLIKGMPLFLDFFDMLLSSGYTFQQAFHRSVHLLPTNDLKKELTKINQSLKLGYGLDSAVRRWLKFHHHAKLQSLWVVLLQGHQKGISLQLIIRAQSAGLRMEQALDAEKQAQTLGLKLLFPIFFFIFPSLFILIFGSLALSLREQGLFFW